MKGVARGEGKRKGFLSFSFIFSLFQVAGLNGDKDEIINCQPGSAAGGKRPSKIDIPFVVSIGEMTILFSKTSLFILWRVARAITLLDISRIPSKVDNEMLLEKE